MIECTRCGAMNAVGRERCMRCKAYLPVTLPNGESDPAAQKKRKPRKKAPPLKTKPSAPAAAKKPNGGQLLDYNEADKGVATLIQRAEHAEDLPIKLRKAPPEVPFALEEEGDVFTSAEILDDGSPHAEKDAPRQNVAKPSSEAVAKPSLPKGPRGKKPRAQNTRDSAGQIKIHKPLPPLPTRELETVVRKVIRPEAKVSGKPPSKPDGPVTYVPGKGIVPQKKATPTPAKGPPPVPTLARTLPDKAARKAAAERLKAAVKAQAARSKSSSRTPEVPEAGSDKEDATLVTLHPTKAPRRDEMADVIRLGAMFTRTSVAPKAEPVQKPDAGPNDVTSTEISALSGPVASARLEHLDPDGSARITHRLSQGRHIIGRVEGDILLKSDPTVSPWHAQLFVRKNGIFLKDMGTLNGVHVRITGEHRLSDRDSLLIGGQRFFFRDTWDSDEDSDTVELGGTGYADPARLVLKRAGGQIVGVYFLGDGLTIGRSRGELVFAADERMQEEHALIKRSADKGGYLLQDLSGGRGIYVAIDEEIELSDGQSFQVGRTRFRLVL